MKTNRIFLLRLLLVLASAVFLVAPVACSQTGASTQQLQGLLQGLDGKQIIIAKDDGEIARITIQDDKAIAAIKQNMGREVQVTVRDDNGRAAGVQKLGEDQEFNGVLESAGPDAFVIGGRTFVVNANTVLDGGLVPGVPVRVEFVTMPDGRLLALQIETDQEDKEAMGVIQSVAPDAVVIDGVTFKVNAATRLERVAAGTLARVEFVTMADGSKLALEIEGDRGVDRFMGTVRKMGNDDIVVDDKTFRVNPATRIEDDMAEGKPARVNFIQMSDGSLLATRVYVDDSGKGSIELQQERERERQKQQERELEQERQKEQQREQERQQEKQKEQQREQERQQEKQKEQQREQERQQEKQKEQQREQERQQEKQREQQREQERQQEQARQREQEQARQREQEQMRQREQEVRHELERERATSSMPVLNGAVQFLGNDTVVVAGKTIKLNAATEVKAGVAVGKEANVRVVVMPDGSLLAVQIEVETSSGVSRSADRAEVNFPLMTGTLQGLSAETVVVAGKAIKVNAATEVKPGVALGSNAKVRFVTMPDGSLLATQIEPERAEPSHQEDRLGKESAALPVLNGTLSGITADAATIGGTTFKVNAATEIKPGVAAGVNANVRFVVLPDGSMLATQIEVEKAEAQRPEDRPAGSGSSGQAVGPRLEGMVQSIGADSLVVGGQIVKLGPATQVQAGLMLGANVKISFNVQLDGTVVAKEIEIEAAEARGRDAEGEPPRGQDTPGDDKGGLSGGRGADDTQPDDRGGLSSGGTGATGADDKGGTSGGGGADNTQPDDRGGLSSGGTGATGADDKGGTSGGGGGSSGGGSSGRG